MPSEIENTNIPPSFPQREINKQDYIIGFFLFLAGIITRIPFAGTIIHDADSARFALALEQFDVTQMRPHAPGYIVYVALGKMLDLFINDAFTSLLSISIVSSSLTVIALYFLATEMYGRASGAISALSLMTSPLFWFNSEMPLTYPLEGLIVTIFAYLCYRIISGKNQPLIVSAILLGLATGVRQHIFFLLLPLWLYTFSKCSRRQILFSVIVLGLTCIVWFIPMTLLSGGLKKYLIALYAQYSIAGTHPDRFLFQIKGRGIIFSTFMVYSLSLGLIPMLYYCGRLFRIQSVVQDYRRIFLLLWILPGMVFFIGVLIYNSGHVVFLLPPLFIIMTEAFKAVALDFSEGVELVFVRRMGSLIKYLKLISSRKVILLSLVSLLLVTNVYIFLFEETQISYTVIKKGDRHLSELVRLTKANFVAKKSLILACRVNTQAGLYLPDYLVYCPFPIIFSSAQVPIEAQNVYISFRHQTKPKTFWLPTDFKIEPIPVPNGITTLVLWEEEIAGYYKNSSRPLQVLESNPGSTRVYFLNLEPGDKIVYGYRHLTII